jgi:hypothetical protein
LKFDNKLKLAKRKQETADTKKVCQKTRSFLLKIQGGEADPQIEYPESMKNRLTRIGAEADPHSLIMAKERAKFLESPTNTGYASRESPSSKTQRDIDDVFNKELSIFSSINAMLHEFLQHYKLPVILQKVKLLQTYCYKASCNFLIS